MRVVSLKPVSIFLILIVVASVMTDVLQTGEFGEINFFRNHSVFFLIFITIFPRLTLLFSSVATGGFIWWLGFIFCPRVLVASLATVAYLHTNPVLVTISWVVAFFGETLEKVGLGTGRKKFIFRTFRSGPIASDIYEEEHTTRVHRSLDKDDAIEAEFTKKS